MMKKIVLDIQSNIHSTSPYVVHSSYPLQGVFSL